MIEVENLKKIYTMGDEQVAALAGVSLSIARGEHVAVIGPSGSGKSSLMNILGGLDRPSSGAYRFEGEDVGHFDDNQLAEFRRRRIGFVFQSFHLVPRLTAFENVELPLTLEGIAPEERRVRVAAALDAFDLADRAHHKPNELSGGQRQRVAIARATILQPAVLLADEPTGNLDHRIGAEVVTLLEDLHRRGTTLVVVTHDRELGARAKRHIAMRDGRIVGDDA